jgi:hypothetical protein
MAASSSEVLVTIALQSPVNERVHKLREEKADIRQSNHLFASFPPELWPGEEEEEMDAGKVFLRLKDGTRLPVDEPDYGKPKGDLDACRAHTASPD